MSLAPRLIPTSDVSEQISTAGYEVNGTSDMKFVMNSALTVGAGDGATIEMAGGAGEEKLFVFGLTAEQVRTRAADTTPARHYQKRPGDPPRPGSDRLGALGRTNDDAPRPIWDALLRHAAIPHAY